MADTLDLGSSASRLAGSSPASPTRLRPQRSKGEACHGVFSGASATEKKPGKRAFAANYARVNRRETWKVIHTLYTRNIQDLSKIYLPTNLTHASRFACSAGQANEHEFNSPQRTQGTQRFYSHKKAQNAQK